MYAPSHVAIHIKYKEKIIVCFLLKHFRKGFTYPENSAHVKEVSLC